MIVVWISTFDNERSVSKELKRCLSGHAKSCIISISGLPQGTHLVPTLFLMIIALNSSYIEEQIVQSLPYILKRRKSLIEIQLTDF